ncbi:MAG: hypothetical protein AB7D08_09440 [Bacteroidales bacterium]
MTIDKTYSIISDLINIAKILLSSVLGRRASGNSKLRIFVCSLKRIFDLKRMLIFLSPEFRDLE